MTPASRPTLGNEMGGVRFTDAPRSYMSPVATYAPTGWENAPVEGMDDDPTGMNALRGILNGLLVTALFVAFVAMLVMTWGALA